MFAKDLTQAFSSVNIPLAKLGKSPMKKFFKKYLPNFQLRDPINYRRTWLPKVVDERRANIEKNIQRREHFVVIFVD